MNELVAFVSSSSSSDEDEQIVQTICGIEMLRGIPKNEYFSENTVPLFNEQEFQMHFRIPRNIMVQLAAKLEESPFYPKCSTGFEKVPALKCLQIFSWFVGHEAVGFRDVADRFNISISKMHNIIEHTSLFLSNLANEVIKWPSDEEKTIISEGFQSMGFPGVVGIIDGTHFKIDTPTEDALSYYNRKKYYSIHMQAVCDHRCRLIDVYIGYPGSVHDARVFRTSPLARTLEARCGEQYILGDSAYPCRRNLLTPYKFRDNLNALERNYNQKLSKCRIVIEHCFGLLKQKFRMLYHIKLRKVENICHLIRACCVLHNLSLEDAHFDVDLHPPADDVHIDENDEEDHGQNRPAFAFRNYVASMLDI